MLINFLKGQDAPVNQEFQVAAVSFVERDGFLTITDRQKHSEMRLPRWVPAPWVYTVLKDGTVLHRRPWDDRYHGYGSSCSPRYLVRLHGGEG